MDEIFMKYRNKLVEKNTNETLECIKNYGISNNIPIILEDGLSFLKLVIKLYKPKSILEIGTAIGYSAINMALIDDDIQISTVERDENLYNIAFQNVEKMGLNKRIKLYNADALEFDIEILNQEFDLIFIDGAKAQYQKFFEKYEVLLKDNGIIICDNLLFHGFIFDDSIKNRNLRALVRKIKRYNEWLLSNPHYDTDIFEIGDGIAVSIKK